MKTVLVLIAAVLFLGANGVEAKTKTQSACGTNLKDWCAPAKKDDPCGQHKNAEECKADPSCYGMKYSGPSMVACQLDERGFGKNCPTVGCTSVRPSNGGTKFFYSMPSEASSDWAYRMPSCVALNASDSASIKKCAPFNKHESCETNQTVELSNVQTNEKKKFNLIYHVFPSKKDCEADQNSALEGE